MRRGAGPRQAKPQAVQKYDKARRPQRSNDVSRVVLAALTRIVVERQRLFDADMLAVVVQPLLALLAPLGKQIAH